MMGVKINIFPSFKQKDWEKKCFLQTGSFLLMSHFTHLSTCRDMFWTPTCWIFLQSIPNICILAKWTWGILFFRWFLILFKISTNDCKGPPSLIAYGDRYATMYNNNNRYTRLAISLMNISYFHKNFELSVHY